MSQNKHTKRETIKGKEINTLRYGIATRLKVGVAFPAIYSIAMSNLAFQTILKTFNDVPDTLAHRFVFPEPLELSKMISPRGQIRSIETSEPMYNYDIIAFSLNYENDIINALQMIDLGNIPLRCDKRSKQHPLVILGGVVPTLNPEPFADFFDIILLGESESIIPRICKVLSETYSLNRIRYEALESASTL